MNRCYLGLGSNQNNPERQIRQAIKALKNLPSTHVNKISRLYWNKAWGVSSQQDFCNAVVEIKTILAPQVLLKLCKKIEDQQGRTRKKHWGPRTLDIDIIFYGNRTINTHLLQIPHPYYKQRDFVIIPLLEINPQL